MKKLLLFLLISSSFLVSLFTIVGFFGANSWFFDLFSHFRLQYLIILIIGILGLLLAKKKLAYLFIVFLLVNVYEIQSLYYGGRNSESGNPTLKITCINLLSSNGQFEDVASYITSTSADVVILQEFTTLWQLMMKPYLSEYPYKLEIPRQDNFGIAMYSKQPFTHLEQLSLGSAELPSIRGDMKLGNESLSILATHPLPPVGRIRFEHRNNQLESLAEYIKYISHETILIGDLNTTSYSYHFKRFQQQTNLFDSRRGYGMLTTWPTWLGIFAVTLDHALLSEGINVVDRKVGSHIGSDHFPIFIEISL